MKDLLIQTANETGLVDAEQLAELLENNKSGERLDETLLHCPYFTEEVVLKLFAAALGREFLAEISPKAVPVEFVKAVPAGYAQHHYLIGIKNEADDGELTVVLSKPLDENALDNVSKMMGLPVRAAISTRAVITSAIDIAYEQRTTVIEEVAEELDSQNLDQLADEVAASDDLLDVVNRPPLIRLVNDILFRRVIAKHNIMVGVSLDGLEKQHNAVRGYFDRTFQNAMILKNRGLLGGIIAVLTTANYKHITNYLSFLTEKEFRKVSCNEYYANGRGTREFTLSGKQLFLAWKDILDFMLENQEKTVCDRLTLHRLQRYIHPPDKDFFRKYLNCTHPYCHAGIKMIHVSAGGDIFPCGSSAWADSDGYCLGNISDEIIEELWIARLKTLHKKPPEYYTECSRCSASQICSFGCSAFEKNDYDGKASVCAATKLYYEYLESLDFDKLSNLLERHKNLRIHS